MVNKFLFESNNEYFPFEHSVVDIYGGHISKEKKNMVKTFDIKLKKNLLELDDS